MPLYDFICDNPNCASNVPLSSGIKPGMEAVLSYQEYLEKKDGCACPICETGTVKSVPVAAHIGKSNQPAELSRMLKERSREHDRKHELEPPKRQHSPLTPAGQEIMRKKKGLNLR